MEKTIAEVRRAYNQLDSESENRKVSRAVKEAMQRIHQALILNPEFSPFSVVPLAEKGVRGVGETGVEVTPPKEETDGMSVEEIGEEDRRQSENGDSETGSRDDKPKQDKKPSLRIATPNAVVKRLKFGDAGVTCCLDHLGEDGPECMTEGTIYLHQS